MTTGKTVGHNISLQQAFFVAFLLRCVCVYIYVCVYTHMYVNTHIHTHIKFPNAKYALCGTETELETILSHLVLCK